MIKKSKHHSHIVGNIVYHQPQLCRQRKPGPTQLVDKFIHVTGILNTIVLNTSMSFQEHQRQDEGVASASEDLCVATRVHFFPSMFHGFFNFGHIIKEANTIVTFVARELGKELNQSRFG